MTLLVAFVAGLVSCVSPCVLPVIPVYAGYVAGAAPLGSSAVVGSSPTWRAIGFLLGFLGVFVLIWASVGVAGFALISAVPALRQVGGGPEGPGRPDSLIEFETFAGVLAGQGAW